MKISIREALFGGEEVDDWTPTTWQQYFTMLPAGKGAVSTDQWTQEQIDMIRNRFGKDKFLTSPYQNRLEDAKAMWVTLEYRMGNSIVLTDRKIRSKFALTQTNYPWLLSNDHFAIVKNMNIPQDKLQRFLEEHAEELGEILSSEHKIEAAYRLKVSWGIS